MSQAIYDAKLKPLGYERIVALAVPVNAAFTQGAGTLGTATYYYRVSALNAQGETLASTETSLAITGPAGVNVNWGAVAGATGYKVYGRSTGAELLIATVGAVTTYLDDGSITPSGALPSASTAAQTLTVPAHATLAVIKAAGQAVRWRDDGVNPTATVGMQIAVGESLRYTGGLAALRTLEAVVGGVLDVSYYGGPINQD